MTVADGGPAAAWSLDGRSALVTGSSGGLGRAIVGALAAAGARVVGADRDPPDAGDPMTGDLVPWIRFDQADRGSIASAADEAIGVLGSVDICVNCAGIGGRSPATGYPEDLWDRVMAVNLTGTFALTQRIGAHMVERRTGSIVTIASVGGLVGYPGSVGYQTSKGGVVQMTRSLAVEWGPSGVRVNAVAPGHIATDLVRRQWQTEPELREFFLSRTPLGHLGEPDDVANAVLFLASDAARMITGHVLPVDGGYTSH